MSKKLFSGDNQPATRKRRTKAMKTVLFEVMRRCKERIKGSG